MSDLENARTELLAGEDGGHSEDQVAYIVDIPSPYFNRAFWNR